MIRQPLLLIAAGLAALALSSCESATTDGNPAPVATASTNVRPPAPDVRASLEAAGVPPTPNPAAITAYIAALKAIDPAIVGSRPERTITRGRDQCTSIHDSPTDRAKLIDLTNERFTAPDHPDGFGKAKAAKILDAVHQYLCPNFPMG